MGSWRGFDGIIISHLGNIDGRQPEKENQLKYLQVALDAGYHVCVEVVFKNGAFLLPSAAGMQNAPPAFFAKKRIWSRCHDADTLDALCERYGVDNSHRTLHGALLDASLLAEVFLAMSRGQESLIVETDSPPTVGGGTATFDASQLAVLRASREELAEHEKILAQIDKESKGRTLWRTLSGDGADP